MTRVLRTVIVRTELLWITEEEQTRRESKQLPSMDLKYECDEGSEVLSLGEGVHQSLVPRCLNSLADMNSSSTCSKLFSFVSGRHTIKNTSPRTEKPVNIQKVPIKDRTISQREVIDFNLPESYMVMIKMKFAQNNS